MISANEAVGTFEPARCRTTSEDDLLPQFAAELTELAEVAARGSQREDKTRVPIVKSSRRQRRK